MPYDDYGAVPDDQQRQFEQQRRLVELMRQQKQMAEEPRGLLPYLSETAPPLAAPAAAPDLPDEGGGMPDSPLMEGLAPFVKTDIWNGPKLTQVMHQGNDNGGYTTTKQDVAEGSPGYQEPFAARTLDQPVGMPMGGTGMHLAAGGGAFGKSPMGQLVAQITDVLVGKGVPMAAAGVKAFDLADAAIKADVLQKETKYRTGERRVYEGIAKDALSQNLPAADVRRREQTAREVLGPPADEGPSLLPEGSPSKPAPKKEDPTLSFAAKLPTEFQDDLKGSGKPADFLTILRRKNPDYVRANAPLIRDALGTKFPQQAIGDYLNPRTAMPWGGGSDEAMAAAEFRKLLGYNTPESVGSRGVSALMRLLGLQ